MSHYATRGSPYPGVVLDMPLWGLLPNIYVLHTLNYLLCSAISSQKNQNSQNYTATEITETLSNMGILHCT